VPSGRKLLSASGTLIQLRTQSNTIVEVIPCPVFFSYLFDLWELCWLGLTAYKRTCHAPVPNPAADEPKATAPGQENGSGRWRLFLGIQDVFQHVKGVKNARSGYSGGAAICRI